MLNEDTVRLHAELRIPEEETILAYILYDTSLVSVTAVLVRYFHYIVDT